MHKIWQILGINFITRENKLGIREAVDQIPSSPFTLINWLIFRVNAASFLVNVLIIPKEEINLAKVENEASSKKSQKTEKSLFW